MSFKLSELLNPAPTSGPPSPKAHSPPPSAAPLAEKPAPSSAQPLETQSSQLLAHPASSIQVAASSLPALAQSEPSYRTAPGPAWNNHQYGESAGYGDARRTSSSIGSFVSPVEPSQPVERSQHSAPSLEQYHHGSKSPEGQRRQSIMSMPSGSNRLAPIHPSSFPDMMHDHSQPELSKPPQSANGQDASVITSPSVTEAMAAGREISPNTVARARELDYVRQESTVSQIRAPSPPTQDLNASHPLSAPPQRSSAPDTLTSPPPHIKPEPAVVSREPTPAQAIVQTEQVQPRDQDQETLKAVASAKNEHGLRGTNRESNAPPTAPLTAPLTATAMDAPNSSPPSKKRKPVNSVVKKGGGGKKPNNKKRKVEDTEYGSLSRPSPTPSSRTSKTPGAKSKKGTPIAGSSPAPQSSPSPQDDEVESGSDDGIYCICRKGDNHTWMIACDGPCQDWYHGTCVKVREEDEELIEKYFCPQCTDAGEGRTTWKRMCRRQGCRRPAQRDKQSKYCSDECGVRFFKDLAGGLRGGSPLTAPKSRTRRKTNQTDNMGNEEDEDEDWTGPRGGVLSVRDLKAMADEANDVGDFKNLGNSMLSPPNTASPTQTTFKPETNGTNGEKAAETTTDANPATVPATYTLDSNETTRVEALTAETAHLQERIVHFKDKERFIAMSREAAGRYAEREGIKVKDICGYDGRLAWSDGEFARWRASKRGKTALRLGTLEPPSPVPNGASRPSDVDGEIEEADTTMTGIEGQRENGVEMEVDEPEDEKTMCTKKRCGKHHQWLKVASLDAQFEINLAKQQLATLEAEEKDIRERAMMRWRSEKIEGERNREGWVEVIDG